VAVDGAGNVFTSRTGEVTKTTPEGVTTTLASSPTVSQPKGMVVDASGTLYVADAGNNNIVKITSSGTVSVLAGSPAGWSGSADGTGAAASSNRLRR
jgi:DNA-binding beta-propeller fold protein YncE